MNLNSIRIRTVRGHTPYKYPPRNTMPKSPGTNSNPLRISWSDTSFSPTVSVDFQTHLSVDFLASECRQERERIWTRDLSRIWVQTTHLSVDNASECRLSDAFKCRLSRIWVQTRENESTHLSSDKREREYRQETNSQIYPKCPRGTSNVCHWCRVVWRLSKKCILRCAVVCCRVLRCVWIQSVALCVICTRTVLRCVSFFICIGLLWHMFVRMYPRRPRGTTNICHTYRYVKRDLYINEYKYVTRDLYICKCVTKDLYKSRAYSPWPKNWDPKWSSEHNSESCMASTQVVVQTARLKRNTWTVYIQDSILNSNHRLGSQIQGSVGHFPQKSPVISGSFCGKWPAT